MASEPVSIATNYPKFHFRPVGTIVSCEKLFVYARHVTAAGREKQDGKLTGETKEKFNCLKDCRGGACPC
ncbi:MAG TPA: hypothetical protein VJT82_06290, partial [Pyrinomonadaceae bacterium]|nr:hypothetical protein [Pyrinomonadaceae bacterium]